MAKKIRKKIKAKRRKPARKATKRPQAQKNRRAERDLDEGLRETFPGSDAVAVTDPVRGIKE
jgi:hypothetical protein